MQKQPTTCSLLLTSNRTFQVFRIKQNDIDCRFFGQVLDDEGNQLEGVFPITLDDGYHDASDSCLIQLQSGRILFSCAFRDSLAGAVSSRGLALVYYSDDEGESWEQSPQMIVGPLLSESGFTDPVFVAQDDGHVQLWTRSDHGVKYQCYSSDEGITWSRPLPILESL